MAQMIHSAHVCLLTRLTGVQSRLMPKMFSPFSNIVSHDKGIDFQYKLRKQCQSFAHSVMQLNMELLFQLRELLLKIQYCLIKVILIFNLQLYCIKWSSSDH